MLNATFFTFLFQGATFENHLSSVRATLAEINTVLAHHSPVLIIQRWFRGHLTRKYTQTLHQTVRWYVKKCYQLILLEKCFQDPTLDIRIFL